MLLQKNCQEWDSNPRPIRDREYSFDRVASITGLNALS